MKVKEIILKKIPLYLNEKYYPVFVDILQNIQLNPKIFENSSIGKMFDSIKTARNKRNFFSQNSPFSIESPNNFSKKNYNTSSILWSKIITAIFNETEYNNNFYSQLEICYLKYKANQIYTKLNSLSYEIKKPLDYLMDIYLNETQKIIESIISEKDFTSKTLEVELNQKILLSKKSINSIVKKINEDSDDEKEQEKTKMLNFVFDKVDLEKYFQKEQIAEIKRGEFTNAIINHNHCFTPRLPNICRSAKRKIIKKDDHNMKKYKSYVNTNKRLLSFNKNKNDYSNKVEPLKKTGIIKENKKFAFDSFNERNNNTNCLQKLKYNELKNKVELEKKIPYITKNKTDKNLFTKRNLFLNDAANNKKIVKGDGKGGKSNYTCTNRMVFNFINKKDLYY